MSSIRKKTKLGFLAGPLPADNPGLPVHPCIANTDAPNPIVLRKSRRE
jgi:hypothetical protein